MLIHQDKEYMEGVEGMPRCIALQAAEMSLGTRVHDLYFDWNELEKAEAKWQTFSEPNLTTSSPLHPTW